MSSKTIVSRTYPRVPYAAFDKDGGSLVISEVLDGIRKDAELVAHYALQEMTEQNLLREAQAIRSRIHDGFASSC